MTVLTVTGVIAGYFVVVNLWSIALVWWDKRQAGRGGRRIRERTLYFSALIGGFLGGIWAMRGLRHKTVKTSFIWRYTLAVLIHISAWVFAIWLAL